MQQVTALKMVKDMTLWATLYICTRRMSPMLFLSKKLHFHVNFGISSNFIVLGYTSKYIRYLKSFLYRLPNRSSLVVKCNYSVHLPNAEPEVQHRQLAAGLTKVAESSDHPKRWNLEPSYGPRWRRHHHPLLHHLEEDPQRLLKRNREVGFVK